MKFGEQDIYVSTRGNDKWTGRLAEPNGEGTDGPLATLDAARGLAARVAAPRRGSAAT